MSAKKFWLNTSAKMVLITLSSTLLNTAQAKLPHQFKASRSVASTGAAMPSLDPEIKLIKNFYTDYLNQNHNKQTPNALEKRGEAMFSKVFQSLVTLNSSLCERKAPGEICGWSADGDPYLNAQDFGPGLNSKTAKLSVTEMVSTIPGHKMISVKFVVDPTDTSPRAQREMQFVIGLQKSLLVVDDLIAIDNDSSGKTIAYSSVAAMRSEINTLFELK